MDDRANKIQEVVIWFNLFDYPLTTAEIRRYLPIKLTAAELESALAESDLVNKCGFWVLPGAEKSIDARQARTNHSDRKFKRVKFLARVFFVLPWLQLMAVVNLMGSNNLKDQGDIDLLIIARPNRVWLTRFIMTVCLKLLNLRPKPGRARDKFCLSFFLSTDDLDLSKIKLENDPYLLYWLACLTPIMDRNNTYQKLLTANQDLLAELPNWQTPVFTRRLQVAAGDESNTQNRLLAWLDKLAQRWQVKTFPPELKALNNLDTRVMTGRGIIKLHSNDRRAYFANKIKVVL